MGHIYPSTNIGNHITYIYLKKKNYISYMALNI